jgi:hypothetical protein
VTRQALPARGIAQAQLAELLEAAGCPLCRHGARSVERFIASMLWERVSDTTFRLELVESGGFCDNHTRAVTLADRKHMGGTLGTAILHRAVLEARLTAVEEARRHRGRSRAKRLAAALVPARCPACVQRETAVADALAGLLELAGDPAWSNALVETPFCLDHLGRLIAAGGDSRPWLEIEERQLARLRELTTRLASYVHHSSHDRRHLLTDAERGAADEATRTIAGETNG